MKPLNRGELRSPHKDRSHKDYKHSVMLGTGEKRVRPVRGRIAPLEMWARMPDGTFQDVREWTSLEDQAAHKSVAERFRLRGPEHREERKRLRMERRAKAFRAMTIC